jgi:hypothetical protein
VAKTQQKIWSCFTQNVIGKYIAKSWRLENRAAQAVFERLERNKAKVLRYVLRETGSRNAPRLPGNCLRNVKRDWRDRFRCQTRWQPTRAWRRT